MATTATITPTLGSAPVTLQAGNYSAIDDRRFWSAGLREGTLSTGSYQVIQRAAGANMTVDVASSVGNGAIVQGDSVTAQGNYFVPPTAANVNVDIAAADATNPRNDIVVLEVKDDQHDAGGLNLARVRVITGTPNASAALTDNPGSNGTPALPSSCFLLAVVRVAAAASSIVTAAISDRRVDGSMLVPDACKAVRRSTQNLNNTTFTWASFTAEDFDTNNLFAATDTKVTISRSGLYHIVAGGFFASNATGRRTVLIEKNAASAGAGTVLQRSITSATPDDVTIVSVSCLVSLVAADTVHLTLYQSSGGALNAGSTDQDSLSLSVTRLGPSS